MLAHCYTPHCTPRPSPYVYKRKAQSSRTRRLAARENGLAHEALSLSHANACNPLLQAHSPWAQDNTKAAGSPLLFSTLCVPSRADPSGLGHAATIYLSVQGPPQGRNADSTDNPMFINEQIHKNAQATTVLLASLCRDEYNKVSGLDNAKQI
jgi:hypothetical protein